MRRLLTLTFLLCLPASALAQQRPLVTEDPETIGAGRVLVEAGFDYGHDVDYPVSGLTGDVEDFSFATKIRIAPETMTRPSFGFRFAAKLPNANNETGLGLDTTDLLGTILIAKTVQSVRVVGNVGIGIFGVPTRGDQQNDMLLYGLSFARALTQKAEVVGEVNGRLDTRSGEPPPGTESRGMARFGARYTIGAWRGDVAMLFGLTAHDPSVGFGAGFTYVFDAFKVP